MDRLIPRRRNYETPRREVHELLSFRRFFFLDRSRQVVGSSVVAFVSSTIAGVENILRLVPKFQLASRILLASGFLGKKSYLIINYTFLEWLFKELAFLPSVAA